MHRVILAFAMVILVACEAGEGPLWPNNWQGVTQTAYGTNALTLVYTKYGSQVIGQYFVGNATSPTGKAEGEINGDVIILELTRTTSCTISFTGTISETRIIGSHVPGSGCSSLTDAAGTWDLIRK